MRSIFLLLAIMAIVFATAPDWVAEGREVNYNLYQYPLTSPSSTPSSTLEFTVTSRTSDRINMDLRQTASGRVTNTHPIDNVDDLEGEFWFDPVTLQSLSAGQAVSGWRVSRIGEFTVAGQEWDSIALSKTIDSASIVNTYDLETGLLLSNNVTTGGQIINAIFVSTAPSLTDEPEPPPADEPPPAPDNPPPANNPPAQNDTPPAEPPSDTTQNQSPPEPEDNTPPSGPLEIPEFEGDMPDETEPPPTNIPCVPGIFILLLVGAGVYLSRY